MNSQQVLTSVQNVLLRRPAAAGSRNALVRAAVASGRSEAAARKASTMRLAQWARGYRSAI